MKFRRDLIIVALATFCLTSTLFLAATSRSADSPNWDPWADIKEDGTVDIYDAITLANAFGSSGDTPKNVNVTNWPSDYEIQQYTLNMSSVWTYNPVIFCGGHSRLSILANPLNASIGLNNSVYVRLNAIGWNDAYPSLPQHPYSVESVPSATGFNFFISNNGASYNAPKTYITETKGPYCILWFSPDFSVGYTPPGPWWITFDYAVYLRNE